MHYENLDDEKAHSGYNHLFRHPELDSWSFTKILVTWITPLINLAFKRSLNEDDIYPTPDNFEVSENARMLTEAWALEREFASKSVPSRSPSLVRVIFSVYRTEVWKGGGFQLLFTLMQLLQPLIISQLIQYVSSEKVTFSVGMGWAIALGAVAFLSSSFLVSSFYTNRRLGLYVRAGMMMMIYEHSMKLSAASRISNDIGTTTNLMSIDAEKMLVTVQFLHFLWQGPLTVFFVMVILGVQLGSVVALTTLFSVGIYFPLQRRVALAIGGIRRAMVKDTDTRVNLTSEALKAIRAIKVYAWEDPVAERVAAVREREMRGLWKYLDANNVLRNMNTIHLPLTAMLIFVVYVFVMSGRDKSSSQGRQDQSGNLTVSEVLLILAYLNIIRFPLNLLAQAMKFAADGKVSVNRIADFLLLPSIDTATRKKLQPEAGQPNIALNHACFSWGRVAGSSVGSKVEAVQGSSAVLNPLGNMSTNGTTDSFFSLQQVSLILQPGELVAVIGAVGSGKSSLISALLGEMPIVSGTSLVHGHVAYAAQSPWIQNMSLRDNILFGQTWPVDGCDERGVDMKALYAKCVERAALLPDFAVLPHADDTEIGEKGINLSGGQKARVAFCRVLMAAARSDIILLDDPFSAVDGQTGNWMFDKGVMEGLKNKTRVVVLNSHLHLLSKFDRVLILEGGRVAAFASPGDLVTHYEAVYRNAVGSITKNAHGSTSSDKEDARPVLSVAALLSQSSGRKGEGEVLEDDNSIADFSASSATVAMAAAAGRKMRTRSASGSVVAASVSDMSEDQAVHASGEEDMVEEESAERSATESIVEKVHGGQLIAAEQRTQGAVSLQTVASYFGAFAWTDNDSARNEGYGQITLAGVLVTASVFMAFALTQVMRVLVDLELMSWARQDNGGKKSPYFVGYIVCLFIYTVCVFLSAKLLIVFSVRSAFKIHKMMFRHVMNAPINLFFDIHTVGSMLNRFAKDLETIDVNIPEYTFMMLNQLFVIMSVLILCVWSVPPFLLVSTPLCAALALTARRFICISRDLKRLEAVSRSPIYSSFSETLSGLETIRAFGETSRFITEHAGRMNRNQKLYFHLVMCQTWLTSRMEYGGCCVLVTIGIMAVIIRHFASASISSSRVGLAVVYTLQLTAMLQRNVQLIIDLINYFTSMERVMEYAAIPQEMSVCTLIEPSDTCRQAKKETGTIGFEMVPTEPGTNFKLAEWPKEGRVEFLNVWLKYRPNTPYVLRGVSFTVHGGERIGICGRTGAGKSSIMQALFRIVEADKGDIVVDGLNTREVPLRLLRSRLAIIPQDPVIFVGNLRYQLDPFEEFDDAAIWEVLDKVNMTAAVRDMPRGLQEAIAENGENLSQGQKQLLCIARAFLRKAKVLVMDEATSAVDPNTDEIIQRVLRMEAQSHGTTILTIAHRLHTILDFDRILVLGSGEVIEYDTPSFLLANRESAFSCMLRDYNSLHHGDSS